MLNTGCGSRSSTSSRNLYLKPFEEMMNEYYKRLQIAEELILETEVSSSIIISGVTRDNFIEYLKASFKIIPESNSRQKILALEVIPQGNIMEGSLEFTIHNPSQGLHEFKLTAETSLMHEFIKVADRITFPLKVIPAEHIKYTRPSLMIDSDFEKIGALASSISRGEDDLYRVVFKVSKWVRENVETQIDASTVSTSQKASWVLENRKGVCDEKSNLFIGLLRSLGIPAKFIIGLVGTNYNSKINFKLHSWAEVYFPSRGWIPFDVAYNQLGFIDATHIKLTESADTSNPITSCEWKSVDISDGQNPYRGVSNNPLVHIKDLEIKTKVRQITGVVAPLPDIKPEVWYRNIDRESCNVIEASIVNPHNFYVITDIFLQIPGELEIKGENNKMIVLEPNTAKTLYWIVKPAINVSKGNISVFPVNVVSSRNAFSSVEFNVAKGNGYNKHSCERLKNLVEKKSRN